MNKSYFTDQTIKMFSLKESKKFLIACKGHKYELHIKLIMTYRLSRYELLFLEWDDIDFENDSITIYPVKYRILNNSYKNWEVKKIKSLGRTLPLLSNIKELLLLEKEKQNNNFLNNLNYNKKYLNYICVRKDGEQMNQNVLSRNIRYIARDNGLPQILQSALKQSLDNFICVNAKNYDEFRCWTRFDIEFRRENIYSDINLLKSKKLIRVLNDLIAYDKQSKKSDIEMWGLIWKN